MKYKSNKKSVQVNIIYMRRGKPSTDSSDELVTLARRAVRAVAADSSGGGGRAIGSLRHFARLAAMRMYSLHYDLGAFRQAFPSSMSRTQDLANAMHAV